MSGQYSGIDWTPAKIESLRALWDEGHSTAKIGLRMDISKNAVVGKARRIGLPARPSPIRRDDAPRRSPPTRKDRQAAAVAALEPVAASLAPETPTPAPVTLATAHMPALRAPMAVGSTRVCQWIDGPVTRVVVEASPRLEALIERGIAALVSLAGGAPLPAGTHVAPSAPAGESGQSLAVDPPPSFPQEQVARAADPAPAPSDPAPLCMTLRADAGPFVPLSLEKARQAKALDALTADAQEMCLYVDPVILNGSAAAADPAPATPSPPNAKPMPVRLWTRERNAILIRDWPAGRDEVSIRADLNDLPGMFIKPGRVSVQAAVLKVKRPPGYRAPNQDGYRPPPVSVDVMAPAALPDAAPPAALPPASDPPPIPRPSPADHPAIPRPAPARPPAITRPSPIAIPDGEETASYDQIRVWAADRGLPFDRLSDLAAINAKCRQHLRKPFRLEPVPMRWRD